MIRLSQWWDSKKSITLSLILCYTAAACVLAAMVFGPWIVEKYYTIGRHMTPKPEDYAMILSVAYPMAVPVLTAIFSLVGMLYRIRRESPFSVKNVRTLRFISWCCFLVALITFVGGFFKIPFWLYTAASLFLGVILRVIKNVMQQAVELREENDLTV